MDDSSTIHHEEEEEEEALSLRDLPLDFNENENTHSLNTQYHQRSSESSDFFEFFNNFDSEMSHAEDIFFCGRLVPFKDEAFASDHIHQVHSKNDRLKGFHRRRCESLSELKMIDRSNSSTKTRLVRSCRSLDYRKMHRSSSLSYATQPGIVRALSDKSSEKCDHASVMKVSKPRWYMLTFGLVKFPQEMDLQDIKNRQIRRKPGTMFALSETSQKSPVNQNDRKSSWGLLKVLSCKNHASVPVTGSISYVPQV